MIPLRFPSKFQTILTIVRALLLSSVILSFGPALVEQSQASAKRYTLRLGVFSNPDNARTMAQDMERAGLEAFVKQGSFKGLGQVSMVYLGRFESIKEAERAAEDLLERGLISEYVIKILPQENPSPPPERSATPPEDRSPEEVPLVIGDITFKLEKGVTETVLIHGNRPFTPKIFDLEEGPPRLAIDIGGVKRFKKGVSTIPVDGDFIQRIRVYLHHRSQTLRVVLDHHPSPEQYGVRQIFYEDQNIFAVEVTRKTGEAPVEAMKELEETPSGPLESAVAEEPGDSAEAEVEAEEPADLEGSLEQGVVEEEAELLPSAPDGEVADTSSEEPAESKATATETEAEALPPPSSPPDETVTEQAESQAVSPDDEANHVNFAEPTQGFLTEEDVPTQEQDVASATEAAEEVKQAPRLRVAAVSLKAQDVHAMLVQHDFYSSCFDFNTAFCNPTGDFSNTFVENGDETVTDHATGLMWQRSGSKEPLSWLDAGAYVEAMNRAGYAGYTDWRLPTAEELASLIEIAWENGDLYLSTVFDNGQRACWSADRRGPQRAWKAAFHLGIIIDEPMNYRNSIKAVRSP